MNAGLIPACAGKTLAPAFGLCPFSAHPRVCGENNRISVNSLLHLGSSPRVRGKRFESCRGHKRCRLIPACAGKTCGVCFGRVLCGAHPRVCGENHATHKSTRKARGSSPRVRGKR